MKSYNTIPGRGKRVSGVTKCDDGYTGLLTFSRVLRGMRGGYACRNSTMGNYATAVRSFCRFCGGKEMPVALVKHTVVRRFEFWLHNCGVSANTTACYMRSLRALYNKAVERYHIFDRRPFDGISTGNSRTAKRGLSFPDIRKLRALKLPRDSFPELTRDMFLFSFYTMGMPLVDVVNLRKIHIRKKMIMYFRQKTGQQVVVPLDKNIMEIVNRYSCKDSEFVFPVKDSRKYTSFIGQYNRCLKVLALRAGVNANITSYVARHSWASLAYGMNVDLPVISRALGHTNPNTTLIYISEIDDRRLAEASQRLIKEVVEVKKSGRNGY